VNIRKDALKMLARREHSYFELSQKLLQRAYEPIQIENALQKLVEAGWLNDARFAEIYMRSRISKGYGPVRIEVELQARGIAKPLIADCLQQTNDFWLAHLAAVWRKKFKQQQSKDAREYARQVRYLQYKGFSFEQIKQFLSA
jgi:regulatory protein